MKKQNLTGKYLITTNNWFYGTDGVQYKAAWGDVTIVEDTFLGLKTNRNSANWFAKVGGKDNHIIIAGCQIFYAIKCEKKPDTSKKINDWSATAADGIKPFLRPSAIYIAE